MRVRKKDERERTTEKRSWPSRREKKKVDLGQELEKNISKQTRRNDERRNTLQGKGLLRGRETRKASCLSILRLKQISEKKKRREGRLVEAEKGEKIRRRSKKE